MDEIHGEFERMVRECGDENMSPEERRAAMAYFQHGWMRARKLLAWIEEEACDLRCINVPTGGDDAEIEWIVIEHHMANPKEREIGRGRTPIVALREAMEFPTR